ANKSKFFDPSTYTHTYTHIYTHISTHAHIHTHTNLVILHILDPPAPTIIGSMLT
ncbi:hypothetical protein LOAG_10308, partial [Loa loa]